MVTETLDARGLKCPLPVLKAKKAMKQLSSGDTLEVVATDPSAPKDFEEFCSATGYKMLANGADGDTFTFTLLKP